MKSMATSKIKGTVEFYSSKVDVPYPSEGIAANASFSTNLKTIIDADIPAGYTFLGFAGFTTNSSSLTSSSIRYSDSNFSFQVRNITSAKVTPAAAVVFYIAVKNANINTPS